MMKKLIAPLLLVIAVGGAHTLPTHTESSDLEAIRDTIGLYFQGHATGNGDYFRQAFHEEANLFWMRDGTFNRLSSADFAARANGTPPADEADRHRRIVNIDVSGNAAVVKVELDYPGALIYDYMSMLKVDGEWKIVNKTFEVMPGG